MTFNVDDLKPGDWAFVWHDTGAFGAAPMPFEVIRVNRETVTGRNRDGACRIPRAHVAGRYETEWLTEAEKARL